MRVIEPQLVKRRSIKKKRSAPILIVFGVIVFTLMLGLWLKSRSSKVNSAKTEQVTEQSRQQPPTVNSQAPAKKGTFKQFTNQEFVQFYSTFAYPNTHEISALPSITGNAQADLRIQKIAEQRGYKLRSAPVSPPVTLLDEYYLQQKAVQPMLDMIAAAKKVGLNIVVTAAFRSIDEQRELFVPRLQQAGASAEAVAAGSADIAVEEALKTVAAPGYSRHHNGFTVDIACGVVGGMAFLTTDCFKWLSADNFKNAKEYGWIPSYPQGTDSTGPEPEPWEYVWVGKDALIE